MFGSRTTGTTRRGPEPFWPAPFWNERLPTSKDHLLFECIVETHRLTQQWLADVSFAGEDSEAAAHRLARAEVPQSRPHLAWLAQWNPTALGAQDLEAVLEHANTDLVLEELKVSVDAILHGCLKTWFSETSTADQKALLNQLEQSSWKAGQNAFQRRWGHPIVRSRSMQEFWECAQRAPFGGFLLQRILPRALELEWRGCPHQRVQDSVQGELANQKCGLLSHWWRGFAYGCSSSFRLSYEPCSSKGNSHCHLQIERVS